MVLNRATGNGRLGGEDGGSVEAHQLIKTLDIVASLQLGINCLARYE